MKQINLNKFFIFLSFFNKNRKYSISELFRISYLNNYSFTYETILKYTKYGEENGILDTNKKGRIREVSITDAGILFFKNNKRMM